MKWKEGKFTVSVNGKRWPDGRSRGLEITVELPAEAGDDAGADLDEWGRFLLDKHDELLLGPMSAVEEFAAEVGAEMRIVPDDGYGQPLPTPPLPNEPVRVPVDENGVEMLVVPVEKIEILFSKSGTKMGRVHGPGLPKFGVAVWLNVLDQIWGNAEEMDVGSYPPPRPVKAVIKRKEYKGKLQPDVVVDWA